jgi:hypothetical protein
MNEMDKIAMSGTPDQTQFAESVDPRASP